jgi:hypothetical protein
MVLNGHGDLSVPLELKRTIVTLFIVYYSGERER